MPNINLIMKKEACSEFNTGVDETCDLLTKTLLHMKAQSIDFFQRQNLESLN